MLRWEVELVAVRLPFYSESRRRWRSWLLLGGLVALTTGLVFAGVSAGRRTAGSFPQMVIFGLVLIVFGTTTLLHVLIVSLARRRRETGLLRSLGFTRRQIASSVLWQTTTIAFVGVPVGIAIGRGIWQEFALSLGVSPDSVVVPWVIAAVAVGTFIAAMALAVGPAVVAVRSRPASLLRSE
jgi:putative ABC transport system permease protein